MHWSPQKRILSVRHCEVRAACGEDSLKKYARGNR